MGFDPITIGLALGAVFTGGSLYNQNKSYKEQKKANALQRKQAEMEAARARRDQVRQTRMAHAAAMVTAEGQGVSMSSGAYGGQGSIISQGSENLSFMDRSNLIADQTSKHLGKAMGYANTANMFAGLADLSMSFASYKVKADKAAVAHTGSNNPRPTNSSNNYFTGG